MKEQTNTPHLKELVAKKLSRRKALKMTAFVGAGAAAASLPFANTLTASAATTQQVPMAVKDQIGFEPIKATTADDLVLAPGFSYTVLRSQGDYLREGQSFGDNNDYIAYFPIDFLQGGNNSADGLLWVNHEYFSPLFISGRDSSIKTNPTSEQLAVERYQVGGTIMHVRKDAAGKWSFVDDPTYNRRISGWTLIDLDGPAAGSGAVFGASTVQGTVGNCAGGYTPWGTALTAEENYQDYKPDVSAGGYGWGKSDSDDRFFTDEHYGWIVEVDPFSPNEKAVKHTAMGRFRHEGATVALGNSGKVVVYMGYDRADFPVYKFVSEGSYNPADGRATHKKLLSSGKLYAADFSTGKWIELTPDNARIAAKYKTAADMLVNASDAALLAGATPCDRPEDIKISPLDKSIFISMTNNSGHGNFHGHITRIFEAGNDHEALEFAWEVFATGGPKPTSNFSSPDNLIFDAKGNLWVFVDVSSNRAGKGIYKTMGNNGIYVIPTVGDFAGIAYQFGSGPIEAETTGPFWTPDAKTLFLSVQHPGEDSPALDKLTSNWPKGNGAIPKSSVVAITGF